MICTIRIPDVLQGRIDMAAGEEGRSKWILEACRMRLDNPQGILESLPAELEYRRGLSIRALKEEVLAEEQGYRPKNNARIICDDTGCGELNCDDCHPETKFQIPGFSVGIAPREDLLAKLRSTVAAIEAKPVQAFVPDVAEIPLCNKDWWEDGNHYQCLMDQGHKNPKHGIAGMVRKLDD